MRSRWNNNFRGKSIMRRTWRQSNHCLAFLNSAPATGVLGRSLVDLLATVQHLENCGVDLFIDQQFIDTTTPTGKLMFQIVGAFAEFERSMIRERVHAGLKRAVANGKTLGRPLNDPAAIERARAGLQRGQVL